MSYDSNRLLVAGSRSFDTAKAMPARDVHAWDAYEEVILDTITQAVDTLADFPSSVIHGGAKGADKFGQLWAEENVLPYKVYRADWAAHGRAAGHVRNAEMAKACDMAVVLWDLESRGTAGMIACLQRERKPHVVVAVPPSEYRLRALASSRKTYM